MKNIYSNQSINHSDAKKREDKGEDKCNNRQKPQKRLLRILQRECNKQITINRKMGSSIFTGEEMTNERITENFVREHFSHDAMVKSVKIEEQKTRHKLLKELLKNASKKGTGKSGYPEFIITFPSIIDLVIIVECKADVKNHAKNEGEKNNPEKYAVDGVLHYASFLKSDFNVVAIAVSGERKDSLRVTNFYIKKGEEQINKLTNKSLLSLYDYLNIFEEKQIIDKLKDINILIFANELNKELYYYSVPENERAKIVSGILIALQNKSFRNSYSIEKKPADLVEDLLKAIERVLKSKNMGKKTRILMGEYGQISNSNKLAISDIIRNLETGEDEQNTLLRDLIFALDRKVFPFTEYNHIGYDILGQFYSEFIRYVNGDKKLGLVLTPQHITELFVDLANLKIDDIIYDNCCGTGGFLIKGMKKLTELAGNDTKRKIELKQNQIIGVEERSDMFTYSCSNMMMRGDGKSNIHLGDSLSTSVKNKIKKHTVKNKKQKPTVGFLNPPYSTAISELEFVYNNLECLDKNSTCIAIIPIGCIIEQNNRDIEWKRKILQEHTLEAVFSMPNELFYPIGTIPSIIVLKAHNPHPKNYETYFGYWKDDGFIKIKNLGRVDFHDKWEEIKEKWVNNYFNRREVKGESVKKAVSENDEWCAEAYMETDYSTLSDEQFKQNIKKYVVYQVRK